MSICNKSEMCSLYVDGELSDVEKNIFEKHLLECSKCRVTVDKYIILKNYIVYENNPSIDLNNSFNQLVIKRKLEQFRIIYKIFSVLKRNSRIISQTSIFLFLVVLTGVLLSFTLFHIKNNAVEDYKFKPIIPISCRSNLSVKLRKMQLSDVNMFIFDEMKMSVKQYDKLNDTFNSFSSLYSQLRHNTRHSHIIHLPVLNNENVYQYKSRIPIYNTLNRHE